MSTYLTSGQLHLLTMVAAASLTRTPATLVVRGASRIMAAGRLVGFGFLKDHGICFTSGRRYEITKAGHAELALRAGRRPFDVHVEIDDCHPCAAYAADPIGTHGEACHTGKALLDAEAVEAQAKARKRA